MKRRVPLVRIDLGDSYIVLTDVDIDDANGNLWSLIGSRITHHDHTPINFVLSGHGAKVQSSIAAPRAEACD